MNPRHRTLATRPCAWCKTGDVIVTTGTPKRFRETKRFCGVVCARLAGGLTHDAEWGRKMKIASAAARKQKALDVAAALLRDLPLVEAAQEIYKRAYDAGWQAGNRRGTEIERGRIMRLLKRARIKRERDEETGRSSQVAA